MPTTVLPLRYCPYILQLVLNLYLPLWFPEQQQTVCHLDLELNPLNTKTTIAILERTITLQTCEL